MALSIGDVINSLVGVGGTIAGTSLVSGAAKEHDTAIVEQLNRSLFPVYGRARYTLGMPVSAEGYFSKFGFRPADWEICLSAGQAQQLISAVQQANAQAIAQYARVESQQNYTHTTFVPEIIGYLQQIAAGQGRCTPTVVDTVQGNITGTAQSIADVTGLSSLGVSGSTLSIVFIGGLLLLGIFLLLVVLRRKR